MIATHIPHSIMARIQYHLKFCAHCKMHSDVELNNLKGTFIMSLQLPLHLYYKIHIQNACQDIPHYKCERHLTNAFYNARELLQSNVTVKTCYNYTTMLHYTIAYVITVMNRITSYMTFCFK